MLPTAVPSVASVTFLLLLVSGVLAWHVGELKIVHCEFLCGLCSDAGLETLTLLGGFRNNRAVFDWCV